jgi:hypothetical protein
MTFEPQAGVLLDFGRLAFTNPLDELQNIRDSDTAAIIGNTLLANMAEEEAVISQKYRELGRYPPTTSLDGSGIRSSVKNITNALKQQWMNNQQLRKPARSNEIRPMHLTDEFKGMKRLGENVVEEKRRELALSRLPQFNLSQPGSGVRPPQRSFHF